MASVFELKVVPSSGKTGCKLDKSGKLKCYLKSPAQKGLANKELIKFISKALSLTQKDISITFGKSSRNKRVKINIDISFVDFCAAFGLELQQSLF